MFMIETKKLLPGDIILTAQKSTLSKTIRKTTSSNFSHVMMYIGEGVYIHADNLGVRAGTLQRLFFQQSCHAKVIRLKNRCENTAEAACTFTRIECGKQYSVIEAIKSKQNRAKLTGEYKARQFCSRLVAQAYASTGVKLVFNPNYCYPQDIADSSLMIKVEDCIRTATSSDLEVRQIYDTGNKQNSTVRSILRQVRKIANQDIQTLGQVAEFLAENPHHDEVFTKIMNESGYLDLWLVDIDNCYWRYDVDEFIATDFSNRDMLELANEEIISGTRLMDLYVFMFIQYSHRLIYYPLAYYLLIKNLYLKLIKITAIRINIAKLVINKI